MQNNLIHRIVLLLAFAVSMVFFVIQLSSGYDFLEAAYSAACVMLAGSIILMFALQWVVKMLFNHLVEKQQLADDQVKDVPGDVDDDHSQSSAGPEATAPNLKTKDDGQV